MVESFILVERRSVCKQNNVPRHFLILLYMSDTLLTPAFSYSPLLLQSSIWFLIRVSLLVFSMQYLLNVQIISGLFPSIEHCQKYLSTLFVFRCTFVFSTFCRYCLCVQSFPCYSSMYAVGPYESLKGHMCTTTDLAALKTKLFLESSRATASSVYLRSRQWKWECLHKSCHSASVPVLWLETVKRIRLLRWSLGEVMLKLNTTETSQRCFTIVSDLCFLFYGHSLIRCL